MAEKSEKKRVQLDFSREAFEKLERLREANGAPTNAATIRNALAVLEWVVATGQANREILVRKQDGETELVKFLWSA